jgi:molybdate transport system substrate-binding protein
MSENAQEFRVMTSGVFTAAYLSLVPVIEAITGRKVVTLTTSIGTGEQSIPNRLGRREAVDLVIVPDVVQGQFVEAGHVLADSRTVLATSVMAVAVRAGAGAPDARTAEGLRRTFLAARCIAYSASESGKYLTTRLYQALGIAGECLPKSRFVGNGERTGAVVARGDADIAFQQKSELLPVSGIAHITPIPDELQVNLAVAGAVPAWSSNCALSRAVLEFLASAEAARSIEASGLRPMYVEPAAARMGS